ncbi:MAG TPA: glucose-6-phosphate dehydrogenase [Bacteroidales bacterium]|nr:glucose-6-phosphate dehydrogenase [Bacteroidales bacterium]
MEKLNNLIFVIFGASGDLTSRKLLPAICSLERNGLMPESYAITGVGRTKMSTDEFREAMKKAVKTNSEEEIIDENKVNEFVSRLYYYQMDYSESSKYLELKDFITGLDSRYNAGGNYIFHMATPPEAYETITEGLSETGLGSQKTGFRRFIIEKPFGYDLESGCRLTRKLHDFVGEDQIYRIDHYLGKESVQNLLVTRFANGIFEPLWNRNYIGRVEITSAENLGIEDRGGYYDKAGALRDMVQNHLLQIVGLTAMEPPSSLHPDAIRNEVLKVFHSLQEIREEDVPFQVIRGQYTSSIINGEPVKGYRQESRVAKDSRTETYVAMKFFIDNWRWGGVPFYIRTGKRLPTKVTEIVIHFRGTPHHLFRKRTRNYSSNQLIVRIQPDEGILFKFDMKEPGAGFNVKNVSMDFHYSDLANLRMPSAYERLLNDVMAGDQTLFSRDDEVEMAWKFLQPVQKAWENDPSITVYGYPAGTWGPIKADELTGEGMSWRYPCRNMSDNNDYCEL